MRLCPAGRLCSRSRCRVKIDGGVRPSLEQGSIPSGIVSNWGLGSVLDNLQLNNNNIFFGTIISKQNTWTKLTLPEKCNFLGVLIKQVKIRLVIYIAERKLDRNRWVSLILLRFARSQCLAAILEHLSKLVYGLS